MSIEDYAVKAADTSRASTTTLADDPDLTFVTEANTDYLIELCVLFRADATPDFKWTLAHGGTTVQFSAAEVGHNVLAIDTGTPRAIARQSGDLGAAADAIGNDTATFRGILRITALLSVGAAGGTFSFQWAQRASDAAAAVVYAGSWITADKIT